MSRRSGSRRSGNGRSFICGSFFGFIMCLATLFGLGCFIYYKVSPAWLNKTFNTNIDLGSEEVNNKTIKNFVNSAISLAENMDTYTLNDLKTDFGVEIEDELFGLDIADLKTVGLLDLPEAIEDKFANISADELRDMMDLDDMSAILDKTNAYFYNAEDEKLYKVYDGTNYSSPVTFKYEISEDKSKVTTKGYQTSITLNSKYGVVNQVNIQLWYLPLTDALGDFTNNMGDQITLADLENDFGVELPEFFDNVDKQNTTVNELEDAINNLYVADFLNYTLDTNDPDNIIVRDQSRNQVTGIMAIVAKERIGDLGNIKSKFDTTKISEILNLNIKQDSSTKVYYDDKNNNNTMEEGEEVIAVMKTIAETKVEDLADVINSLKVSQIFTEAELQTGILSLVDGETLIEDISSEMESAIKNTTMAELIEKGVIEEPEDYETLKDEKTTILKDDNVTLKTVSELTLPEMIEYCFDLINAAKQLNP